MEVTVDPAAFPSGGAGDQAPRIPPEDSRLDVGSEPGGPLVRVGPDTGNLRNRRRAKTIFSAEFTPLNSAVTYDGPGNDAAKASRFVTWPRRTSTEATRAGFAGQVRATRGHSAATKG
jgi:hypothetical protein